MQTALNTTTASVKADLAIDIQGLGKQYRTGFWLNTLVSSLTQCTLQVRKGETFGLLGPNGAGKTTLLKILLGIAQPTTGTAYLLGKPLGDQGIKSKIGYLPENPYFYDYLTGLEVLSFTGQLFNLSKTEIQTRSTELLARVGLSPEAGAKQLRKYSKGMLQRIGMAQALINDPELVFLDEPMSGLDPTGRFQMRELILSLKHQGKTVFFNSHILSDVEQICDRVGILAQGELVGLGSLDELLGVTQTYRVRFKLADPQPLADRMVTLEVSGDRQAPPDQLVWEGVLRGEPAGFATQLAQVGGVLLDLKLQRPSLEAVFLDLVRSKERPR